jgi:hypothetical protein
VIVVGTGHRPEKISDIPWLKKAIAGSYVELNADKVIQGCAAGSDLIMANVAWVCGIPYVAAKPWGDHKARMGGSSGFKSSDAGAYDKMIKYASEVVNVSGVEKFPGNWAYFKRNEWMVDQITPDAGCVLAIWDGSKSGTSHCVEYAQENGIRVFRIDPSKNKVVGWIE